MQISFLKSPTFSFWTSCLFSLVAVGSYVLLIGLAMAPSALLWIFLFFLFWFFGYQFFQTKNARLSRYAFCFSWPFSFFFLLGTQLTQYHSLNGFLRLGMILLLALFAAPSLAWVFMQVYGFFVKMAGRSPLPEGHGKKVFWGSFAFLFLCWLVVFLAYYPGLLAYDAKDQIPQATTGVYDSHHPLVHTLLLGAFYLLGGVLGSYNIGIALYCLFQMAFLCLILSYAVTYLYKAKVSTWFLGASLCFFALFPVGPILGISTTKDTLFSALFLLLVVSLHQIFLSPGLLKKPLFLLRFLGAALLFCLFRNNGVIALAFLLVFGFLFLSGKKARLRFSASMLVVLFASFGISAGLQNGLHSKKVGFRETLSVPLQQVSRVFHLHNQELDCGAELVAFVPYAYFALPHLSDPIKSTANVDAENLPDFFKLWASLLVQYPVEYLDAFLLQNLGFWYLDDLSHSEIYGVGLEKGQGYVSTYISEGFSVERRSLLPSLESFYDRLFTQNEYLTVPFLSFFFSPSFFLWSFCLLVCYALYTKNKAVLFASLLLLGNIPALLLGPAVLIRYAFPYVLCCPILLGLVFQKESLPQETDLPYAPSFASFFS